MPENATTQLAEAAAEHQINILRVEAGMRKSVIGMLSDLEADLASLLEKKKDIAPGKKAVVEAVMQESAKLVKATYQGIDKTVQGDLEAVADATATQTLKSLGETIHIDTGPLKLSAKQLTAIAKGPVLQGSPMADWWAAQDSATSMKVQGAIRQGMLLGEGVEELQRRIRGTKAGNYQDGILQVSRNQAEAIVRTGVQSVANQARIDQIKASSAVVKGIEWVATLDTRTTPICKALDGLQWRLPDLEPIGHDKAFPGPIAHWGCRSTQVAVTRSWAELSGKKIPELDQATFQENFRKNLEAQGKTPEQIKQIEANTRASMDGQVSGGLDYEAWLKKKGDDFALKTLGPQRFALWKSGKLSLRDMTDQWNRPLTAEQLVQAASGAKSAPETEGQDFIPLKPGDLPDYILKAAEIQAKATQEIADVIANPAGQTLLAKALVKLQKDEPGLSPVETLAKAQGIASEKQAAATKASVLSGAKKKLIDGQAPTPGQQAVIDALTPQEAEAFNQAVQDAILAQGQGTKTAALNHIQEAVANGDKLVLPKDLQEALAKAPKAVQDEVNQTLLKAQGDTEAESLLMEYETGSLASAVLKKLDALEASNPAAKDTIQAVKADIAADLANQAVNAQLKDMQAAGGLEAQAVAMTTGQNPSAHLGAAAAKLKQLALEELTYGTNGTDATVLKKKALKKLTGIDPEPLKAVELQSAIEKWATGQPGNIHTVIHKLHLAVLQDAATAQAAASKSSVLSQAKKKILEGKEPTPAQKALLATLTPEETAAFNQAVADAKKIKQATDDGKVVQGADFQVIPDLTPAEIAKATVAASKQKPFDEGDAFYMFAEDAAQDMGMDIDEMVPNVMDAEPPPDDVESLATKTAAEMAKAGTMGIQKVDISAIKSGQVWLHKPTLVKHAKTGAGTPLFDNGSDIKAPLAFKKDGQIWLMDGNHRVAVQKLAGKQQVELLLVDLDTPPGPPTPAQQVGQAVAQAIAPGGGSEPPQWVIDLYAGDDSPKAAPVPLTAYPDTIGGVGKSTMANFEKELKVIKAQGDAKDKSEAVEVHQALTSKAPDKVVVAEVGKVHGAAVWEDNGPDSIVIQHFGTVPDAQPGTAEAIMLKILEQAEIKAADIEITALGTQYDFFTGIGFGDGGAGVSDGGVSFMLLPADEIPSAIAAIKSKLAPVPTPAAKAAKVVAAAKATAAAKKTVKTTTAPDLQAQNLDLYVPDPAGMTVLKTLPGSTAPLLMQDPATGKKWVVKSPDQGGGGVGHLKVEATADAIYRLMGASVPESKFMESGGKPYKVAAFLENAQTLGDWEAKATPAERETVYARLQENFVLDALLGNWDVAGQSNDNIMVVPGPDGKPWPVRVDNGGSLQYRAMGSVKSAAQWNATVTEIQTLRDPSTSAGKTSQIFKTVTQEQIHDQISRIVAKKDEIIALADREGQGRVIRDRIDHLEKLLPPAARTAAKKAAKKAMEAATTSVPEPARIATAAKKARINGVAVPLGSSHIEDMQALVWQETKRDGAKQTVVAFKATDDGMAAIRGSLPANIVTSSNATTTPGVHPEDAGYAQKMLQMAKTLATHNTDKAYNSGTVAEFQAAHAAIKTTLAKEKAKPASTQDKGLIAMLESYEGTAEQLAKAHAAQAMPPKVPTASFFYDPTVYASKKAAQKAPEKGLKVTKTTTLSERELELERGYGKQTGRIANSYTVQEGVYEIEFPDGATAKVVGRNSTRAERQGLALEGTVMLRIDGEATPDTIREAMAKLEALGLDTKPPSEDYQEWVWLAKTAHVHNDTSATWNKVAAMPEGPAKIQAARDYLEKKLKVKIPKRGEPGYTAAGVPNSFGDGTRHVWRADLPPQTAEQELKGLALFHSTSKSIEDVLDAMLASGGEATPTIDRIRKGIGVAATGGMSPDSDIRTGGASYFFTRVRKKTSTRHGLYFKIRNAGRADAVIYDSDKYGRISALGTRKASIDEIKKLADYEGSDETIFKRGLFLLDEIDIIKAGPSRDKVLAVFKKHGITRLTDGRKVEDVVK